MATDSGAYAFIPGVASSSWLQNRVKYGYCKKPAGTRRVCRNTRQRALIHCQQSGSSISESTSLHLPSGHEHNVRDLWHGDDISCDSDVHAALQSSTTQMDVDDTSDLEDLPVVGDKKHNTRKAALPWDTTGAGNAKNISYLGKRVLFSRMRNRTIQKSYAECERITALFAKTFHLGTSFLPMEKRKAVWAIYTWCRRTDDLVDGPRVKQRSKPLIRFLADWEKRLEDIFWRSQGKDALDLALADVVLNYKDMSITPFRDMIKGMLMDVKQSRFETFRDLYLYCYRVAGTVGLMTLPILGTVKGNRAGLREAAEPALALGIALQLTNILRDVGEDRLRGRIYIPLEDLRRFNYTEEDLFNCVLDTRYRKLMQFQIARARRYFKVAEKGVDMLSEDSRLPVRASLDMYSQILDVLEENDYDNFHRRAFVSKSRKAATVPLSYLRIQKSGPGAALNRFLNTFISKRKADAY